MIFQGNLTKAVLCLSCWLIITAPTEKSRERRFQRLYYPDLILGDYTIQESNDFLKKHIRNVLFRPSYDLSSRIGRTVMVLCPTKSLSRCLKILTEGTALCTVSKYNALLVARCMVCSRFVSTAAAICCHTCKTAQHLKLYLTKSNILQAMVEQTEKNNTMFICSHTCLANHKKLHHAMKHTPGGKMCHYCGKVALTLRRCSRCKVTYYCDEKHQTLMHKKHSTECKKIAASRTPSELSAKKWCCQFVKI